MNRIQKEKGPAPEQLREELRQMFVTGSDLPAAVWKQRLQGRAFAQAAARLIWQSEGERFILSGSRCLDRKGQCFSPEGPVGLAHPVELDAEEILHWRGWLAAEEIPQPFRQMGEPVVLREGTLPGGRCTVTSAGAEYEMLDRYRGYRLDLDALPPLAEDGFRPVCRSRWDEDAFRMAEIERVNLITPAGILYGCRPLQKMETLEPKGRRSLALGLFYPLPGTRLRVLNHTAAVLEDRLLDQCARKNDLDMLLPHLPGMAPDRLRGLLDKTRERSKTRAFLERVLAREEGSSC